MTKTCKQRWMSARTGRWVQGYRPHVVPEYDRSGYATCAECGREVYVGQGPFDPYCQQVAEGVARFPADRAFVGPVTAGSRHVARLDLGLGLAQRSVALEGADLALGRDEGLEQLGVVAPGDHERIPVRERAEHARQASHAGFVGGVKRRARCLDRLPDLGAGPRLVVWHAGRRRAGLPLVHGQPDIDVFVRGGCAKVMVVGGHRSSLGAFVGPDAHAVQDADGRPIALVAVVTAHARE